MHHEPGTPRVQPARQSTRAAPPRRACRRPGHCEIYTDERPRSHPHNHPWSTAERRRSTEREEHQEELRRRWPPTGARLLRLEDDLLFCLSDSQVGPHSQTLCSAWCVVSAGAVPAFVSRCKLRNMVLLMSLLRVRSMRLRCFPDLFRAVSPRRMSCLCHGTDGGLADAKQTEAR